MSIREHVRRARRRLLATVSLAALLWAAAAGCAIITIAGLVRLATPLPRPVHAALWPLAALAALAALGTILWRWRAVRSLERVALWIEERQPELRFALVTAIDPAIAPEERYPELHASARNANVDDVVRRATRRTLARALLACAPLALAAASVGPRALGPNGEDGPGRRGGAGDTLPENRLAELSAQVTPPAYTRLPAATLEDPNSIAALIGSRIELGGRGPAEGVTATLGADTLAAQSAGRRWTVTLTMPGAPTVVELHDREHSRLVILEPRVDSVPAVRLRLPANDTTYQTVPRGRLVVEAQLEDDYGLDYGVVEYLLTAGGGENFETKRSMGPRVRFANARSATLRDVIDLDTLGLAPGTVLHIRAIAFDYNDVTGPGRGVSETRTLRIAEPEDSTSINPAPPIPIDSMWISQRLLNMKTDTLIRNRDKLDRRTFMGTSSAYSNTQEEIRSRAQAVISILEDDGVGGTFQTTVSRMLREAVELMYEARMYLAIAQPDSAMPYMIEVLRILDEIRLANRYYLRGIVRPQPVNIERVRLTGEDPAAKNTRVPRPAVGDSLADLAGRIERAVALLDVAPEAARDSLFYIRASALRSAPDVASALSEVIDRLQRGEPISEAIARTRRILELPPQRIEGPVEWRGIP